ncbi:MAG: RraA family protein [Alphaproteobacteria bacterium]|nr:RraA family protein [Alphaproteobacteria bacterium]
MTNAPLNQAEIAELIKIDTPTVCNSLEVVAPERRGFGYTTSPLVCAFPQLPPIVGYAKTATIRAMRPSAIGAAEATALRVAYYEYVSQGTGPKLVVIQDLDGKGAGYGAFWGEVNSTVHKTLGCQGVVTDGSIRDLDMIAPGFQLLGGCVGPSHAFVHVVSFGGQVNVAGMTVNDGDLVHADRHGAVVIPHAVARQVKGGADEMARRESVILNVCKDPKFSFEKLKAAMIGPKDIH